MRNALEAAKTAAATILAVTLTLLAFLVAGTAPASATQPQEKAPAIAAAGRATLNPATAHATAGQPNRIQHQRVVERLPAKVRHCGIITCTDYASRSEARTMAANVRRIEATVGNVWSLTCGGLGVMAGAISGLIAGPVMWVACEAYRARMASITGTIKAAAANGQCVAITFPRYGSNNIMAATGWWRYSCNWG
jgi:hypothetical protein